MRAVINIVVRSTGGTGNDGERPLLLFFYDERCGRSRRVDGFLAHVLQHRRNHDAFRLHRVEVSARPDLVERLRVDEVPSLLVVDGKRVRGRVAAPRSSVEIEGVLRPWLS